MAHFTLLLSCLVLGFAMADDCRPVVRHGDQLVQFDFGDLKQARQEILLPSDDEGYSALLYVTLCHQLSDLTPVGATCGLGSNIASVTIIGCEGWGKLSDSSGWTPHDNDPAKGIFATFSMVPGSGKCPNKRSATVTVLCPTGENEAPSAAVDSNDPCVVHIGMVHKAGCPVGTAPPGSSATGETLPPTSPQTAKPNAGDAGSGDSGASGFSVFMFILLVGLALYCTAGIITNMRNEGRQGLDAIPHREFWFALPSMICEALSVVAEYVSAIFSSRRANNYQSFSSTIGGSGPSGATVSTAPPGSYSVI